MTMIPPVARALLRTNPTLAPVPHRALISISGQHASEFLNGIIAASVPQPPRGPFYSAFLNAQGRVLHDVFVYTNPNTPDKFLIEYDSRPLIPPAADDSAAPQILPLLPLLKRYVLRSKVTLRDVSSEFSVWAIWGSSDASGSTSSLPKWNWARSGVVEPVWDVWSWGSGGGGHRWELDDRRAPGMGVRVVLPRGDMPSESSTHDLVLPSEYTLHRVLHGVPEGIDDIPPAQAFPMDSNMDIMGGLDFHKGCYVGQELTVRTYHTGAVRKRTFPVLIQSQNHPTPILIPPGDLPFIPNTPVLASLAQPTLSSAPTPRPRGTGKLLTTTPQGVGLALLRVEHADAQQRGTVRLEFEAQGSKWELKSWWPDWWPRKTDE